MKITGINPGITDSHAVLADRVFDGQRWHVEGAVLIRAGRILEVGSRIEVPPDWPQRRLPAGTFLAPGFIDLQVNGGGGVLLNDHPSPKTLQAIARAHRRYGTTGCLPTLISGTREQIHATIDGWASSCGRRRRHRPAPGRALHQPTASGCAPSRADIQAYSLRPGAVVRAWRGRPITGDGRARMRSRWLYSRAGRNGCAYLYRP